MTSDNVTKQENGFTKSSPRPEQVAQPQSTRSVSEKPTMSFPQAMEVVKRGGRIRRLDWGSKDWVGLRNNWLMLCKEEDGLLHQLLVSDGDIMGDDWVEI